MNFIYEAKAKKCEEEALDMLRLLLQGNPSNEKRDVLIDNALGFLSKATYYRLKAQIN